MDKKNTMLLTVIAVATLLVAVVGATFAYFSVANATDQTVQANVQTGKIPTVTVSKKAENLYLKVSATDMAQNAETKYFYAKSTDCLESASCYEKGTTSADEDKYIDILDVAVAGGDQDTKYTCTGSIEVTSESLGSIDLTNGDITIGLKGYDNAGSSTTVDAQVVKSKGPGATQNISFNFTGDQTKTISAYVLLENSSSPQNYLANQNLSFSIATKNVSCTIDAAATD